MKGFRLIKLGEDGTKQEIISDSKLEQLFNIRKNSEQDAANYLEVLAERLEEVLPESIKDEVIRPFIQYGREIKNSDNPTVMKLAANHLLAGLGVKGNNKRPKGSPDEVVSLYIRERNKGVKDSTARATVAHKLKIGQAKVKSIIEESNAAQNFNKGLEWFNEHGEEYLKSIALQAEEYKNKKSH